MTDYKITFKRSNGTQGSDTFTANTDSEARHDFRECYRHNTYKIISVEEIKKIPEPESQTYRAEFSDDEIEIFTVETDSQAIDEGYRLEKEHGTLWHIVLLDNDYNEVKTVF